jgi:3-oxoacyl-[acyl-carrier-protein] synthase II
MRRVVITGMGMVSPIGKSVAASWESAVKGTSGVARITAFAPDRLPVHIAGEVKNFTLPPALAQKDVLRATRFIQFGVYAAAEALGQAGLLEHKESRDQYGCCIGVGIGSIESADHYGYLLHQEGPKKVSPFFIPYMIPNMAAGIISTSFGLKGPNLCPATACTSGTHAIGESWMYIRNHMADVMVCGGSESTVCELTVTGFANMKALSRRNEDPATASRPFDRNRDGFVLGEGAGILVLEELEHAKRRGATIYGEIVGYGMSGDAYHLTSPAPEGEGAQRSMKAALASAHITPADVQYINAHGTSTYYNDLNETRAIQAVFGSHADKLWISSTKGVTGHCLGAAGGIEAVFLAKTMETQVAPPTANLTESDPECPLDYVPLTAREGKLSYGLSNSFGFGGTNATLVCKKWTGA